MIDPLRICHNKLVITHNGTQKNNLDLLHRFDSVKKNEGKLLFFLDQKGEIALNSIGEFKVFGTDRVYNLKVNNERDKLEVTFSSPYCPPEELAALISKLFPGVSVSLTYRIPGFKEVNKKIFVLGNLKRSRRLLIKNSRFIFPSGYENRTVFRGKRTSKSLKKHLT